MDEAFRKELGRIAQDLQLKRKQIENVVELLEVGNTVPFITRYRKEQTGNLDEEQIRRVEHLARLLRQLIERRQTILRTIEKQGKLTDELKEAILSANTSKRLEDLYLPYKPKKQTLATLARERGLGPLAEAIWNSEEAATDLGVVLPSMLDPEKQLNRTEDVLTGLGHILAENVAENAGVRYAARKVVWEGKLVSNKVNNSSRSDRKKAQLTQVDAKPESAANSTLAAAGNHVSEFRNYFAYSEPLGQVPPHRILAINRGEKLGVLKVNLEMDREKLYRAVLDQLGLADHPHRELLKKCVTDSLDRLLLRSLEREVRSELTVISEQHAINVFARNLRNLLLQAPVRDQKVLAIDPGFRTGCKYAALDGFGNLLDQGIIYPHVKRKKKKKKKKTESVAPTSTNGDPGTTESASDPSSPTDSLAAAEASNESSPQESNREPPVLHADSVPPSTLPGEPFESRIDPDRNRNAEELTVPAEVEPSNQEGANSEAPPPPSEETPSAKEPPPISKRERASQTIVELCRKHEISVIAIGNGTACRQTEEFISGIIAEELTDVVYVIVNEAGASVYSTSSIAREEFPEHDASLRGTISIGRRLQDPLSELVKIEPQNIGVGLYQHDLNHKLLKEALREVVESCVNYVGVDSNTASVALLQYVSGLNQMRARDLVEHRKQRGPFRNREQFKEVAGIGPTVFTQAAGFLKITGGDQAFDSTWIHPESYSIGQRALELLGYDPEVLNNRTEVEVLRGKLAEVDTEETAKTLEAGIHTVRDILENLARPGRDPREDLPEPIFRSGVLKLEDLTDNMELKGTVLNVVDFGVFVDVGLKDSGLVHISELADRFVRCPHELVAVGDIVTTWVLNADPERRRVSLSMIPPNVRQARKERAARRLKRHRSTADQEAATRSSTDQESRVSEPGKSEELQQARGRHPRHHGQRSGQRKAQLTQSRSPKSAGRRSSSRKPSPPIKLSEEKLKGTQALHTFGELKAFFEQKKKKGDKNDPEPNEGTK